MHLVSDIANGAVHHLRDKGGGEDWWIEAVTPHRLDGVTEPGQAVATHDQYIIETPVVELGEYREPKFGAFVAFPDPQPQYMFGALNINSERYVYGPVTDVAIGADLDT